MPVNCMLELYQYNKAITDYFSEVSCIAVNVSEQEVGRQQTVSCDDKQPENAKKALVRSKCLSRLLSKACA